MNTIYYKDKKTNIYFWFDNYISWVSDLKLTIYKPDDSKLNSTPYDMPEVSDSGLYRYKDFTPDTIWKYIFKITSANNSYVNSFIVECVEYLDEQILKTTKQTLQSL